MRYCLETGGEHTKPAHFRLLVACAEICKTAANFMLIGSEHHKHICAQCAQICEECARDCERLGDMEECVESCRHCAEACSRMAA